MSFSLSAKNEILSGKRKESVCCQKSMLLGALLFAARCDEGEIRFVSENERFIKSIQKAFKFLFGIEEEASQKPNGPSELPHFVLSVTGQNQLKTVFDAFPEKLSRRKALSQKILDLPRCCESALLKGAFLCAGYVTDPEKNYHLEFVVQEKNVASLFAKFLEERFSLPAKMIERKQSFVLYFKESENIEDILNLCGAVGAALRLMEVKVVKDVRNQVNRQVNCETANLSKTVDAASRHKEAIEKIKRTAGLESLPRPLREVAKIRLKYPELNLKELGEALSPPVSKSGVNHRLQKIIEISESL